MAGNSRKGCALLRAAGMFLLAAACVAMLDAARPRAVRAIDINLQFSSGGTPEALNYPLDTAEIRIFVAATLARPEVSFRLERFDAGLWRLAAAVPEGQTFVPSDRENPFLVLPLSELLPAPKAGYYRLRFYEDGRLAGESRAFSLGAFSDFTARSLIPSPLRPEEAGDGLDLTLYTTSVSAGTPLLHYTLTNAASEWLQYGSCTNAWVEVCLDGGWYLIPDALCMAQVQSAAPPGHTSHCAYYLCHYTPALSPGRYRLVQRYTTQAAETHYTAAEFTILASQAAPAPPAGLTIAEAGLLYDEEAADSGRALRFSVSLVNETEEAIYVYPEHARLEIWDGEGWLDTGYAPWDKERILGQMEEISPGDAGAIVLAAAQFAEGETAELWLERPADGPWSVKPGRYRLWLTVGGVSGSMAEIPVELTVE